MTGDGQQNKNVLLIIVAILISRIPFLFSGYGSEEDAWGLILVARNIDLSGTYEVSRMPGHPVQELMLSFLWDLPSWLINSLTAIVSTAGIYFFMQTLRLWNIRNFIPAGLFLAFVPVFYINSTNVMDYTWAITFVIISMHLLVKNNILLAGIILGIACGFRITAGAMVIPLSILLLSQDGAIKKIISFGGITLITALICFIPAFNIYGTGFFTYYEYFPYPPIEKNIYKGTIGAWGTIGVVSLVFATFLSVKHWMNLSAVEKNKLKPLLLMSLTAIAMYTYSFIRIPQKSAFVIPMIPFIAIIFALLLNRKQYSILSILMIISCFFFGINLDDNIRGSNASPVAIKFKAGNASVAFDPLVGMVTADHLKRKQKIAYARQVVNQLKHENQKMVIIAGWWQNELNYFSLGNKNTNISYLYYADENQLNDSIESGNKIYYLPEQAFYNDLRFDKEFTEAIASPLN